MPLPPALSSLRVLALGAAVASLFLGGCATKTAATGDYNAQFASGRYAQAYESSSKVAASLHSSNRDQAALIAGLSARSLDRNTDAKRWLTPLAANADAGIAGKACVALGAIAQEEHQHREAADYFMRAGARLPGDDAAHAFMCAGDSYKALGQAEQANAAYQQAKTKLVSDQQLRGEIGDRLAGGGPALPPAPKQASAPASKPVLAAHGRFTVQTGAFSTLRRAQSEAKKYSGPTKTIPITDHSGKKLYAVQVGRYASKQDADRVRKTLGNGAVVAEVVD
jgi:tetratricopeptide (TPR) repeat protein